MEDTSFVDLSALFAQDGCESGVDIFCAIICANTGEPLAGFTGAGTTAADTGRFAPGAFAGIVRLMAAGITLHSNSGAVDAQGPPFPVAHPKTPIPQLQRELQNLAEFAFAAGPGKSLPQAATFAQLNRKTNCWFCGMFG
jgi:hypothetical protein